MEYLVHNFEVILFFKRVCVQYKLTMSSILYTCTNYLGHGQLLYSNQTTKNIKTVVHSLSMHIITLLHYILKKTKRKISICSVLYCFSPQNAKFYSFGAVTHLAQNWKYSDCFFCSKTNNNGVFEQDNCAAFSAHMYCKCDKETMHL